MKKCEKNIERNEIEKSEFSFNEITNARYKRQLQ
jgi:hypothetical protein